MTSENNSKGYFQKQYISACEQIGEALTKNQISALESTINSMFSPSITNPAPLAELSEQFDKASLYKIDGAKSRVVTELINNLLRYAANIKHIEKPEFNMTNNTALEFYNTIFSRDIRQFAYLKPPVMFRVGKQQTEVLTKYLSAKGIITQQDLLKLSSK